MYKAQRVAFRQVERHQWTYCERIFAHGEKSTTADPLLRTVPISGSCGKVKDVDQQNILYVYGLRNLGHCHLDWRPRVGQYDLKAPKLGPRPAFADD